MIQYKIDLGCELRATKWSGQIHPISGPGESSDEVIEINETDGGEVGRHLTTSFGYVTVTITEFSFECERYEAGNRTLNLLATFAADECEEGMIVLSERSTAASAYAFAQFIQLDGDGDSLSIAATDREAGIMQGMRKNFVLTNGDLSPVIQKGPNGLETNSFAMLNSLGNLLYHSIVDAAFYSDFLSLTGGAGSLLQALVNLAKDPWENAEKLYFLAASKQQIFQPALSELELHRRGEPDPVRLPPPNNWTLTVKFNDSGAGNFLIGGPANFAFDKYDRLWIPNNAVQGTPNSSAFCIVLNPDGSPADISPIFGGGILGCGFGVCADAEGENIWFGNFGWGPVQCNPQVGSVAQFTADGEAISPQNGWTNKLSRVQGLGYDPDGNLWITSWGTQEPLAPSPETLYPFNSKPSAIVVYPKAEDGKNSVDPERAVSFEFDPKSGDHCTFDVAFDSSGNAFVSNSGSQKVNSSVYKLKYEDGEIQCLASWKSSDNEAFRTIQVTESGEVLVGAVLSKKILRFTNDLEENGSFSNQTNRPWGMALDAAGVIYSGNFGRELPEELDGARPDLGLEFHTGVTVIRDEDDSTAKLMTLPTGGHEVMLANGFPLYGTDNIPCYSPLMRMTSVTPDRVGNLWAVNNWKPNFKIDTTENPPGDGVIVFVGVAAPTPPR